MQTTIKKCTCKSDYQDKKYGAGMRVHNLNKDETKAVCTVCGAGENKKAK
jgi:hypothetical protein